MFDLFVVQAAMTISLKSRVSGRKPKKYHFLSSFHSLMSAVNPSSSNVSHQTVELLILRYRWKMAPISIHIVLPTLDLCISPQWGRQSHGGKALHRASRLIRHSSLSRSRTVRKETACRRRSFFLDTLSWSPFCKLQRRGYL